VKERFILLAGMFLWAVARMLVREAAWLTVKAATQQREARRKYQQGLLPGPTVSMTYRDGAWVKPEITYDGPAGPDN
jgi:hypothetical protein